MDRCSDAASHMLGITTDLNARCLAHIVHLAAKHIVQAFSQDGPVMESDFIVDAALADVDDDDDSETSYASGDTLGKLWAFINQVGNTFFIYQSIEQQQIRVHWIGPCLSRTQTRRRTK
jgi:hypothetical protein